MRRFVAGGAFVGALVVTGTAVAQPEGGFVLDRFGATPAGDPFFGVPSPATPGMYEPRGYVSFDYAHRPIRLRDDDVPVVEKLGILRADVSMALFDRLLVDVQMPFALMVSGDDPEVPGYYFTSLEQPQLGDLRIGLRGRLWGEDAEPFQLGVGGYLFAPTGSREQYTGDGAVRGAFHALLGGRVGTDIGFIWSATGGVEVRAADTPHAVTWGGAVGILLADDILQLGAEVAGQTPFGRDLLLSTGPVRATSAGTNAELLVGAKLRLFDGLTAGVAGGPGLGSEVGTPLFRMVGLLGWTPLPDAAEEPVAGEGDAGKGDRDDDGIEDRLDACPDTAGQPSADPTKDGCPPSDKDSDGVPDAEDACPNTAGIRSVEAVRNGCPEDSDGDGVHDGIDKCPQTAGVPSDDPEMNGCAPDADRDRIADAFDACPNLAGPSNDDLKANGCPEDPDGDGVTFAADACPEVAGVANDDPARNGCPSDAPLPTGLAPGEIEVGRHVLFGVTKFTLQDVTNPPDAALVKAIRDGLARPDVVAIEVQGHTDDSGEDKLNENVSQRRAETMRDWLIAKGIPADKLTVKAFSYNRPVADNRIRQGRDQNRRVQFVLVKKK